MQNLYCRTRVVVRVFQHTLCADVRMPKVYALRCVKNKMYTLIAFDGLACFLGRLVLFLMNREEQYERPSLCAFRCIFSEKLRDLSG